MLLRPSFCHVYCHSLPILMATDTSKGLTEKCIQSDIRGRRRTVRNMTNHKVQTDLNDWTAFGQNAMIGRATCLSVYLLAVRRSCGLRRVALRGRGGILGFESR